MEINPLKMKKKSSRRAILLIGGSEVIGQGASFIRRLIILRTIGIENYGIAVPMLLVLGALNRILELNPGTTLIQDRKGSSRRFRDSLQFLGILRGIIFCLVVVAIAAPLAVFNNLDSREYIMGFMFLGLIPLIRGMSHIDICRQLRRRQYETTAVSTAVTPVVTTIMVAILCLFMSSFWVPLIGRVISAVNGMIMSFIVAKRRYRVRYDRESFIRILKFSLPLILGGFVIFVAQHGAEQLLSASKSLFGYSISKVDVGALASAVMVAMIPSLIGSKLITQVFSPKIAEIKRSNKSIVGLFDQIQAFSFTMGAGVMILLQGGSIIIPILLTNKFSEAGPYLVALSIFGAVRISGASTRALALALGKSKIIMYSNFWTLTGLACSTWVVYSQRNFIEIAYCMALGEIISTFSRSIMLKRLIPELNAKTLFFKPTLVLICAFGFGLVQRSIIDGLSVPMSVVVIILSVGVGTSALGLIWPAVRDRLSRRLSS